MVKQYDTTGATSPAFRGFWYWTWSSGAQPPVDTNLGLAFSGWTDPQTALQNSNGIFDKLPSVKYLSLGGGNQNGAWSESALTTVTQAIQNDDFAAYAGIAYDVEEGDSGLSSAFSDSFAAAKAKGFQVLVTVSHSAPYGISDAPTLMQSFFSDENIDILSPQLYTTGNETSNDYTTSQGVTWDEYATAKAAIVPSMVQASFYADGVTTFASYGVTLSGYIQWSQT